MADPFIYISTWKIKEGKLEELKEFSRELVGHIEAREPQLIAMNTFINDEGTEMTSIQVHPDSASMESHIGVVNQILGEDMNEWLERGELIEPIRAEIFGTPGPVLQDSDGPRIKLGIPYFVKTTRIAGFTRKPAARPTGGGRDLVVFNAGKAFGQVLLLGKFHLTVDLDALGLW